MLILRKSLSSILLIILCLTLIACEADSSSSIPLYKYYENKLEAMENRGRANIRRYFINFRRS